MSTEIIKHVPIQALIVQYNVMKDKFERIFSNIDQISNDLDLLLGNSYAINHHLKSVGYKGQVLAIRQAFWRHVFNKLQLSNLMSENKRKEFNHQMESENLPEFNEENVLSTFKNLTDNVQSLMEDTILETFEIFRPHHARHKNNTEYAIGKKAILECMVDVSKYSNSRWVNVNYHRESYLRSIDNAFSLMDGCGPIKYPGDLFTALKNSISKEQQNFETKYFKCRWHYNGTLHFTFKRMDLVEKMNVIGGKGMLNKGE